MSKLLIDTHILLWLLFSPEKLPNHLLQRLEDRTNQLAVSAISFWEISLKYQLGKLNLEGILPEALVKVTEDMGIEIVQISPDELASFHQLPKLQGHKDPFDRLIIWQCLCQNRQLVSHDQKMKAYRSMGLQVMS